MQARSELERCGANERSERCAKNRMPQTRKTVTRKHIHDHISINGIITLNVCERSHFSNHKLYESYYLLIETKLAKHMINHSGTNKKKKNDNNKKNNDKNVTIIKKYIIRFGATRHCLNYGFNRVFNVNARFGPWAMAHKGQCPV